MAHHYNVIDREIERDKRRVKSEALYYAKIMRTKWTNLDEGWSGTSLSQIKFLHPLNAVFWQMFTMGSGIRIRADRIRMLVNNIKYFSTFFFLSKTNN